MALCAGLGLRFQGHDVPRRNLDGSAVCQCPLVRWKRKGIVFICICGFPVGVDGANGFPINGKVIITGCFIAQVEIQQVLRDVGFDTPESLAFAEGGAE